ncbi:homeobox protein H2.0-like [Eupeodes corollae]|uniref:homeobox protein H2.0-like n=1 Tax=Eupeodes corollae TaxID=290404 RepID=UPI00249107C5|nr:homeobox protein H2.0-like [Eupeodes corollae]
MDYAPMQVINPPKPQLQDTTARKLRASDEIHYSSHDQHLDDEIMVTKESGQTLFIGVLSHQEDIEDSDMHPNPKSDHVTNMSMRECVKLKTEAGVETKIKLNFSVDRLLSADCGDSTIDHSQRIVITSNNNNSYTVAPASTAAGSTGQYDCCKYYVNGHNILMGNYHLQKHLQQASRSHHERGVNLPSSMDIRSVVRPTPIRALNNGTDEVPSYSSMASAILKFQQHPPPPPPPTATSIAALSSLMAPFSGLKSLQINQQHFRQQANIQTAAAAASKSLDIPPTTQQTQIPNAGCGGGGIVSGSTGSTVSSGIIANNGKRKRSWSRAVFSNLQRKGLEIQFQQQKYITKPDRRKLAARLNLTDAQVKVWFQNRRMKWRHTRENLKSGQEKPVSSQNAPSAKSNTTGGSGEVDKKCYTSSSDSDEDEIDVVE